MLKYQAHIAGGHYAIESIPANTSTTIDVLASSYNGYMIKPERAHVVNNNNSGNVSVYVAGTIASTVPPFSAKDVAISGLISLVVENKGNSECKIVIVDRQMIEFAQDVYASLTVSSSDSFSAIVNNYEVRTLGDLKNEGYLAGISYAPYGSLKLTGNARFGDRCIYQSVLPVSGNYDAGGLLINSSDDIIDYTSDFTIGFWVYSNPSPGQTLFSFPAKSGASLNNGFYCKISTSTTLILRINGTDYNATHNFTLNVWTYIAVSKIGNTVTVGLVNTSNNTFSSNTVSSFPANTNAIILGSCGSVANANYTSCVKPIDGFSFTQGVGLFTSAPSLPTTPPV